MEPIVYSTIIGFVLLILRWLMVPSDYYFFLPYNLILAIIPLLIAWLIVRYSRKEKKSWLLLGAGLFVWLIFFPNAPYMMTDFIHLKARSGIPIWFDTIIILSFVAAGLLAGWKSLYLLQKAIETRFDKTTGWVFAGTSVGLAGFGVYLGRFLRLNSWDLFLDPFGIAKNVARGMRAPLQYSGLFGMVSFYVVFFLISYGSFIFYIRQKRQKQG